MTALWTAAEAATATGGHLSGPAWQASGVSIDTRTLQPGDLFVALTDIRDGHDFVTDALSKGAVAALVSYVPDGVAPDAPLLRVDDVLQGLEGLAQAARARTEAKVIGVTGSAGKTSTKEMLRHVLTKQGATHASVASYNNHWGVPLTLARMPKDTKFAIIEIGMNHPGEIAPLSRMAAPHVALITTVAAAHLEAFDNIAGIAREKAAIFDGLLAGGTAIFPNDIETSAILSEVAAAADLHSVTFGADRGSTICVTDIQVSDTKTKVGAAFSGTTLGFEIGALGDHFARNALAVLAAVDAVGGDLSQAMAAFTSWTPPGGRGFQETISLGPDGHQSLRLIDDAFNANPASLDAALRVLSRLDPGSSGRRVAILGDMLELGPTELALHAAVADHPTIEAIAQVHCVGPRMKALWEALPAAKRGQWAESADQLAGTADRLIEAGDIVLVKGSKSSHVSRIVDALRALGQSAAAI